jgi:uncharacterized membrane-anchored protein YhcB (DUF1043 family)
VEPVQYSSIILIAAGAALFLLGLGAGMMLGRRTSAAAQAQRDAELKLEQVMQDKKAYEDEVVEHFTDTAKLLNGLTERYREVHDHLAKGAGALCHGRGPISLERLDGRTDASEIPAHLADIRPPLDYAPKASPGEKGMLNEEFGIDRRKSGTPAAAPEAQGEPTRE